MPGHNYIYFITKIFLAVAIYVTGPEKTGLICTKYTYSYYGAYLFFCVSYPNSVSFIEFLSILCIYDRTCVKMLCSQDEILHLKDQNCDRIWENVHSSHIRFFSFKDS